MKERGHIEQLWREEKYHVLLHSQQSYQMIRNAFDHMWGYFKKCANEEERQQSKLLKADFINGKIDTQTLLDFLAELANKYDVQYLLQSRVLNTKRKR